MRSIFRPNRDRTAFICSDLANFWHGLVDRAELERWSYRSFLALLATKEIAHRQQTRLARLIRWEHFPFLKTIDDFNFRINPRSASEMLGSALAADFVTEGRSLILPGKPGRARRIW